jgi:hypothetical protein
MTTNLTCLYFCPSAPAPPGSYTLPLNRTPRALADMEWDTVGRGTDIELSSNCLTATKAASPALSTVRGTILYADRGCHEFHVILDNLGPDGIWVGVAPPSVDAAACVGDLACGWALHSDGDRRHGGREEEFTGAFKNGDVLTVGIDLGRGVLRFSRNGVPLGDAFSGVTGPLVAAVTLASEESKVTIQNRPTVLNMGEYTGECAGSGLGEGREARAGSGSGARASEGQGLVHSLDLQQADHTEFQPGLLPSRSRTPLPAATHLPSLSIRRRAALG